MGPLPVLEPDSGETPSDLTSPSSSRMVARICIREAHFGHFSESRPNVRCIKTAQSTREAVAKSSPSRMRCQCFAVMIVGSPKAAAGTASATDGLGAALDGHASAGDGGAFGAFAGVPIPPTGGALDDDDDAAFALASASLHFLSCGQRGAYADEMRRTRARSHGVCRRHSQRISRRSAPPEGGAAMAGWLSVWETAHRAAAPEAAIQRKSCGEGYAKKNRR